MITTKTLKSGLRIAVNEMKGFEGVSFKMFVFVGSSNENEEKNYGISHLIEHMFFKGTKTRTSLDIVNEFDKYGIQTNAYTSKDTTCYYTYGTNDTLDKSVEIMSDMFFNSTFDEEELKREKQVVIEEIHMYQDRPDSVCEMLMEDKFFAGTNFAHDIAGTDDIVENISREQILNYVHKNYTAKNVILSFAGNITMEEAEKLVNKYYEQNFKTSEQFMYAPQKTDFSIKTNQAKIIKDTNQAQVMIAYNTENRFESEKCRLNTVVSYILGAGMSSRLFQEVREKLGLVYSISASNDTNDLTGMFSISLGTNLKKVNLALKTIRRVIDEVVKDGFTEEELLQAKNMIISSIKLGSDVPSRQATLIASNLQYQNKIITKQEMIENYKKITLKELNEQVKSIFSHNYVITMVSSKNDIDLLKAYESNNVLNNNEKCL